MTKITLTGSGTVGDLHPGWSVTDEATPYEIGDSSGSVGSASLTADRNSDSEFVANNGFELVHDELGSFAGRVSSVDVAGIEASLSVAGYPEFLNSTVTAPPKVEFVASNTAFGAAGSGSGLFNVPAGVAVDRAGDVYVADRANHRIQKFTPAGVYVTQWGSFGTADGQFKFPEAVGVDSYGNVYVGDAGNSRIQKFTSTGTFLSKWSASPAFSNVRSMAVDSAGGVYVADDYGIRKYSTTGTLLIQWTVVSYNPLFAGGAQGVGVDPTGNVFVSTFDHEVRKYSQAGQLLLRWGQFGTGNGEFNLPQGVVADRAGFIYVVDSENHRVQKFTGQGQYVTQWGSNGAGADQYNYPHGAGISANDILYVTDFGNNRIRITNPVGAPARGVLLSEVFQQYVDLAATGHPVTYSATSNPRVIYKGWRDKCWVKLKELAAANGVAFRAVGDQLEVVDAVGPLMDITNKTVPKVTPTVQGGAQQINITYQNAAGGSGVVMYYDDTVTTFDVQDLITLTKQTSNYPITLDPPTATDTLSAPAGTYYVQDSTGLHVPAETWNYYKGGISVQVGDVPGQILITLQGPAGIIPGFTGPFSLVSGTGNDRVPQFSVTGTGVTTSPATLPLLTGADPATMTQEVGQTINNPFLNTLTQAYDRGMWASSAATGVGVTITFEMSVKDLLGFGLDKGSLVRYNDNQFRVTSVRYGNVGATLTAVRHLTFRDVKDELTYQMKDWNAANPTMTFAQFNAANPTMTFALFNALHPQVTNATMKARWAGYSTGDTKIKTLRTA